MIRILVQHNADVNAQNIHGRTALMDAAIYGNVDGVHSLLENGADHSLTVRYGTLFQYSFICVMAHDNCLFFVLDIYV